VQKFNLKQPATATRPTSYNNNNIYLPEWQETRQGKSPSKLTQET